MWLPVVRFSCYAHFKDTLGLSPTFRIHVAANAMNISTAPVTSVTGKSGRFGRVMIDLTTGTSCAGHHAASLCRQMDAVAWWPVVGYGLRPDEPLCVQIGLKSV